MPSVLPSRNLRQPADRPPGRRRQEADPLRQVGYATHDQINALVPSKEVHSEQIADILVMFSEIGVNVVETKEAEPEETPETRRRNPKGKKAMASSWEMQRWIRAETKKSEPGERTDNPVRMYLQEITGRRWGGGARRVQRRGRPMTLAIGPHYR
jgi:hypothetical protein